jgi:hypothetical protein
MRVSGAIAKLGLIKMERYIPQFMAASLLFFQIR